MSKLYGVERPIDDQEIPLDLPDGEELDEIYLGKGHSNRRKWYYAAGIGILVVIIVAVAVAVSGGGGGGSSSSSQGDGGYQSPQSELAELIRSYSPSGGTELDDPDSYQTKAFLWMEESTDLNEYSEERAIQRYVLACIYHATYQVKNLFTDSFFGENKDVLPWQNKDGWLLTQDECKWNGITCDSNGVVVGINLRNNILTGTMPVETGLLKSLKSLNLYNNYFYNVGDAGNNWLGELTNLESLFIGSTSFQYEGIPPAIGKLTKLKEFDCSYTLYFGPLRDEVFENMNQLEYLYIGGNWVNTSVPESITNLPSLKFFYAEDCNIIGDLSFMDGMPKIFELWVDNNPKLTGSLPASLGSLVTLESLSVTECGLTGPIPTELGLLTSMQQMWLYGNKLSGEIPSQLGALAKMNRLEVEKNDLTGIMPSEICDLRAGVLEDLEADCIPEDAEVSCATDCCTCCGEACAEQGDKTEIGVRRALL